jgi:multicomponent Na+:H+ antiporter subunit C
MFPITELSFTGMSFMELPFSVDTILYFGAIGLILIGLSGLLIVQNVFRMLLALVLFESGANLLLVLSGFQNQGIAPIFLYASINTSDAIMNDPVPQALVLTAIVIGVGIQALALALIFKVKDNFGSLDMRKIRFKVEKSIAEHAEVKPPASVDTPYQLSGYNRGKTSHE